MERYAGGPVRHERLAGFIHRYIWNAAGAQQLFKSVLVMVATLSHARKCTEEYGRVLVGWWPDVGLDVSGDHTRAETASDTLGIDDATPHRVDDAGRRGNARLADACQDPSRSP